MSHAIPSLHYSLALKGTIIAFITCFFSWAMADSTSPQLLKSDIKIIEDSFNKKLSRDLSFSCPLQSKNPRSTKIESAALYKL